MAQITVLGAGSWGIALASLLNGNGHKVCVWSAIPSEIDMLTKERQHLDKLPGVMLSEDILFTSSLEKAVENSQVFVLAVPSPFVRQTSKVLAPFVKQGQIIVNVAKGIEENTLMTMTEIIEDEIKGMEVAVLSGPSHAEEVGNGLPTTIVIGAKKKDTALYLQNIFMNDVFRVYISPDIMGIEIGGSLKNVVALAAGIADGLGYGDNTKAALITRGITEIARLGVALGAKRETIFGLTGMGDLIVTCASVHSRNRKAGVLIGKGYSYEEAMEEVKMVVEGVYSTKAAIALGEKYEINLPIIEQVNAVLFEGSSAKDAVNELMLRDKRAELSSLEWE